MYCNLVKPNIFNWNEWKLCVFEIFSKNSYRAWFSNFYYHTAKILKIGLHINSRDS